MNGLTDQQLLRYYTEHRAEAAFAELARRHMDLVYSAAVRMVRDGHLAEDVTQSVFVALAQNARRLRNRRALPGWLHHTTQHLAANAVRTEVRRRVREQEAVTMNELLATESNPTWELVAPYLDAALGELSEPDRDAVLLRYFENKSLREVGHALGTSDDTAQKRVSRAVERLREFFARRGVTVGASGLVVVISANAVQAAPAGLAVAISTAATTATIASAATATATKAIAITTLQKTIVGVALAAAVGTGIYQAREAWSLRSRVQTLQQQHKLAEAGNYWAKFRLWEAYAKGKYGVEKNPAEADKWLSELVKGAYLAKFEPVNGFNPKTPKEMLDNYGKYCRLFSGRDDLGGAGFFRTTKQGDKLIGSFLTASPNEFKTALKKNPNLKLISMEKVTPEMFLAHEAAKQESR